MSVQGSWGHYSQPKENTDAFERMEIGFPSERERFLIKYAEDKNNPTGTVYGYVPVAVIEKVIKRHGGIDEEKTFNSENKKRSEL